MPDTYAYSAGHTIGASQKIRYSPRTQSALRKIGNWTPDTELYTEDPNSDSSFSPDMEAYAREKNLGGRFITGEGRARSSTGGAGYAIIDGKKIYMTEGGGTSDTDTGAYDWQRDRMSKLNVDEIKRSPEYRQWQSERASAAQTKAASEARIAEARAMKQIDRDFEDPNTAALKATQVELMKAEAARVAARKAATIESVMGTRHSDTLGAMRVGEDAAVHARARELQAQGADAGEAVAKAASESQGKKAEKQQWMLKEILRLEGTGNPRFIQQAQELRKQLAAESYSGYVPGAMVTFDQAERAALSKIGSEIKTNLDAIVAPYAEREATYRDQRTGWGSFQRNTATQLAPEELADMRQQLDELAEGIAANTGIDVSKVRAAILKKANAMIAGATSGGTKIGDDRSAELMAALRGTP